MNLFNQWMIQIRCGWLLTISRSHSPPQSSKVNCLTVSLNNSLIFALPVNETNKKKRDLGGKILYRAADIEKMLDDNYREAYRL